MSVSHRLNSSAVCTNINIVVSFYYLVFIIMNNNKSKIIIIVIIKAKRCEGKVGNQIAHCGNIIRTKVKRVFLKRDTFM